MVRAGNLQICVLLHITARSKYTTISSRIFLPMASKSKHLKHRFWKRFYLWYKLFSA